MKTLYLDCGMGAAGDMLAAALLELCPEPAQVLEQLNGFGLPHVEYFMESSEKCGILGTHISVRIHGQEEDVHPHHAHAHSTLTSIEQLVRGLNVSEGVKKKVLEIYTMIAEAESSVHGAAVSDIHFHEVGSLDAVADVTAVCYLMELLSPERVIASPVHVGSGQVRCAHGILPVPAPAAARLLLGCPTYGGSILGELCTPTGAALLKAFVTEFGDQPVMRVSAIGYGMGKKDFERANCVRAMLGETEDAKDQMYELSCNVDDMTAEQIGFAMERCFAAGAAEVFTVPIHMKKSRPGILFCVLCAEERKEALIRTMFCHTSTAGIRETKTARSVLQRRLVNVETAYGQIRRKDYEGYGVQRSKYEYDDLAAIAEKQDRSIAEIRKELP